MLLTLLLACTAADDPKDGVTDDTAADTSTDSGADSGDPQDTSDSADSDSADTADSGDTGGDTSGDTGGDTAADADGDGYDTTVDCDDAASAVHPGAADVCNGVDDDCDGVFEEDSEGEAAWRDGVRYSSLSAAAAGAELDDVISLCPGTYAGGVGVPPVTIEGWARDPARTIIDGEGAGPILSVSDAVERPNPLKLLYLTLRNGDAGEDRGGAVVASYTYLDIEDCVLEDNRARVGGAVATLSSDALTLRRTVFRGNTASDAGGAVYVYGSSIDTVQVLLEGNTFEDNSAGEEGGAFAADIEGYATLYLQYSTFQSNVAGTLGGAFAGVAAKRLDVNAHMSTFIDNSAGQAGALYVRSDTIAATNMGGAVLTDNRSVTGPSGVWVEGPDAMMDSYGTWQRNVSADGSCAALASYGELEGEWGSGADDNVGCDVEFTLCEQVRDDFGSDVNAQCYSDGRWVEG